MDSDAGVVTQLATLEFERCRAISEQDWPALERLLAEDMTHTHMTGRVEDKPTFMDGIKGRPRLVERGEIKIRVYGNIAVMNGRQFNTTSDRRMEMEVLQVWRRRNGVDWQEVAFQASAVSSSVGS